MGTYKVKGDGKAPEGLSSGDKIVTGGGTYTITGVNADGSYKSALTDAKSTTYNYTGGYDPMPTPGKAAAWDFSYEGKAPAEFTYESAPEFVSQYADKLATLRSAYEGKINQGFSYDPDRDDNFAAVKKETIRGARATQEDVLGQYAKMTGGLPSTAAVAASSQASDQARAAIPDAIPQLAQLAQLARSMWQADLDNQRSNIGMYESAEDMDYSQYLGRLGQFNTDRNLAYQQHADQLNQYNSDRDLAYQQYMDALNQTNYTNELAYERGQATSAAALNQAKLAADMGYPAQLYDLLGLPVPVAEAAAESEAGYRSEDGDGDGDGDGEGSGLSREAMMRLSYVVKQAAAEGDLGPLGPDCLLLCPLRRSFPPKPAAN